MNKNPLIFIVVVIAILAVAGASYLFLAEKQPSIILTSSDNQTTLSIPNEALPDGVSPGDIEIEKVDDKEGMIIYDLKPNGLILEKPVTISVTGPAFGEAIPTLFHEYDGGFEMLNTEVNFDEENDTATVSAEITHFSTIRYDGGLVFLDMDRNLGVHKVGDSFDVNIMVTYSDIGEKFSNGKQIELTEPPYLVGILQAGDSMFEKSETVSPTSATVARSAEKFVNNTFVINQKFQCIGGGKEEIIADFYLSYHYSEEDSGAISFGRTRMSERMSVTCIYDPLFIFNIDKVCGGKATFSGEFMSNYKKTIESVQIHIDSDGKRKTFPMKYDNQLGTFLGIFDLEPGEYSYNIEALTKSGDLSKVDGHILTNTLERNRVAENENLVIDPCPDQLISSSAVQEEISCGGNVRLFGTVERNYKNKPANLWLEFGDRHAVPIRLNPINNVFDVSKNISPGTYSYSLFAAPPSDPVSSAFYSNEITVEECPIRICGDGTVDQPNDSGVFEQCDPPGTASCAYQGICQTDCTCPDEDNIQKERLCGDGNIDKPNDIGVFEQCDPPGTASCAYQGICQTDCTCPDEDNIREPVCGDGVVDQPNEDGVYEQCDPPGTASCAYQGICADDCSCPDEDNIQKSECGEDPYKELYPPGTPISFGEFLEITTRDFCPYFLMFEDSGLYCFCTDQESTDALSTNGITTIHSKPPTYPFIDAKPWVAPKGGPLDLYVP
jgi:hypothetical protein